ncbi:Hypothetical protein PBC10988_34390 [Planctomycetales bacterium 10988]|nr:Hypothetical protein PBC10988_34390 [Planctomycetales bacterium 10988]
MLSSFRKNPALWLSIGFSFGLIAGYLLPHSPAHAVATDRFENFAICTTPIDSNLEAICVLDILTGDLTGYAMSPTTGKFNVQYSHNILNDFQLQPGSGNPTFLMVSGMANINPRGGGLTRGLSSLLYVAEINSGQMVAYGLPYAPNARNSGLIRTQFLPMDKLVFRKTMVRPGGTLGTPQ